MAIGNKGMVVGTTGALAVRSGLEALKQGGGATDAAITTALAQTALCAGCWVSCAGCVSMVYYEAATGETYALNARYNSVLDETDPLSIPRMGTPSGRTALVPGFFAGIQAAHDRFGTLPFAELFRPAISFAEKGFELDAGLAANMSRRKDVLTRLPQTKEIFAKENGRLYQRGDLFRQPQLAETLKKVAAQGAEYVYHGEWAKRFVEAVRREGGKMTPKDLENYTPIWSQPLHCTYRQYDVYTLGPPNVGGARTVQGLNLLQCADLPQFGHFANSPKSLYYMVQIVNVIGLLESLPPERCAQSFPGIDLPGPLRINKTTGKAVWAKIRAPGWNDQIRELAASESAGNNDMGADSLGAEHSDALIAVDDRGDIAVLEHTINTASWGTTGIFVDGISIPDSGALNQKSIKEAGPGARVPDATHPLLILKGKNPYLACGSIGGGMYEVTLQNVVNVLDFGMSPKTAADAPCILQCGGPARPQPFPIGDFSDTVLNALQALGQDVKLVTKEEQGLLRGYWVGVRIDPVTGKLEGAAPKLLNGCAMGY